MKKLLVTEAGLIILDADLKVSASAPYTTETPLASYIKLQQGELTEEFKKVLARTLSDGEEISVSESALVQTLGSSGYQATEFTSHDSEETRERKLALIVESGLAKDEGEAESLIREFALELSREKVREASSKPDLQATQAVLALDEIDKTVNILHGRISEWFGLHFPELTRLIEDPEAYLTIVSKNIDRKSLTEESLQGLGLSEKRIDAILQTASSSKGSDLRKEDLDRIVYIANETLHLKDLREKLTKHVSATMSKVAPNLTAIAGATIGARLLHKAGGLERLARLPASTIQILGAEKALFRALKSGGRPPKHGILFQHQFVHSAPKWQRGKMARSLATKIAIAARIDFFRGTREASIEESLKRRIDEIKVRYREPPKEKQTRPVWIKRKGKKDDGKRK